MMIPGSKVNVNFKILPFGHRYFEIKSEGEIREVKIKQPQEYSEPRTTNHQIIEIIFGGDDFKVPKTTGGLF
jgi:hypothetical protein